MARKTVSLSFTQVKYAKPKDKEYNLADGDGLMLRVRPNGAKSWLFNYYRPTPEKKRANISLGTFPPLTLEDARKIAKEYRSLLANGIDPKQHLKNIQKEQLRKKSQTLELVTRQWFELKKAKITDGYAQDIIGSLENHIFPKLGNQSIHDVNAPEVIETLQLLSKTGKLEMIKRICQRLNEVMTYATNVGIIKSNPLVGIRAAFHTPKTKNYPTLKPEELPMLIDAIYDANIRKVTRYMLLWQLHTMTRPGEAAGARWDEIDLEQKIWIIPPERMKKRREHVIPLTDQAIAILEKLREISGKFEFLFPSDIDPRRCANNSTANVALKRMGFKGRLTAHGMRALASTTLNEQGFDPDIIEAALAHVDKNQVRSAYNRAQYVERRREMMEWWSERISR